MHVTKNQLTDTIILDSSLKFSFFFDSNSSNKKVREVQRGPFDLLSCMRNWELQGTCSPYRGCPFSRPVQDPVCVEEGWAPQKGGSGRAGAVLGFVHPQHLCKFLFLWRPSLSVKLLYLDGWQQQMSLILCGGFVHYYDTCKYGWCLLVPIWNRIHVSDECTFLQIKKGWARGCALYYIFYHNFPAVYLTSAGQYKRGRDNWTWEIQDTYACWIFRSAIFPGPNLLSFHDVLYGLSRTCKAVA